MYKLHNADSDKYDTFILYQTCFLETQSGVLGFCFYHENVAYEREMIQLNLSLVQWNTGRVLFPEGLKPNTLALKA